MLDEDVVAVPEDDSGEDDSGEDDPGVAVPVVEGGGGAGGISTVSMR